MAEIIDWGLDWVTLTTDERFSPDSEEAVLMRNIVRRDWYGGQSGVEVSPWGWNGYSGLSFGPLSMGYRPDGSIVRCSGPASRLIGRMPWSAGWRCTRVDLQATVRLSGEGVDEHIGNLVAPAAMARTRAVGRPWSIKLINGYGDGDTLQIGSRTSAVYMRVYNKHAESSFADEFKNCVRYEAEIKNGVADKVFWGLNGRTIGDTKPLEVLQAAFLKRGISIDGAIGEFQESWLNTVPRETDADRQLSWLEKSVAGVVRKLIGQGLHTEVLQALELEPYATMFVRGE